MGAGYHFPRLALPTLGVAGVCLTGAFTFAWRPRVAPMGLEGWRLSRTELRDILNKYERIVEDDSYYLLQPSAQERALLGEELLKRRLAAVRKARDQNRRFVELVIEDLPDIVAGPDAAVTPARPLAEFKSLGDGVSTLPASSYGTLASVFLHLMRDWSTVCDHVIERQYAPVLQELKAVLPQKGHVLLPGAGLGRLALMLASEGFQVEANDASRLFLTFADFILNRAPKDGVPMFPLAHVFSENWGHAQQYVEIQVPSVAPATPRNSSRPVVMVPGDFVKTYQAGGPGFRPFDALVTCFFIDTPKDIEELFRVMDGLLQEGGVWVNLGPLNWRKEARLKLAWEEIVAIWQQKGYEFLTQKRVECDYHIPRGEKMYTESYNVALTTAIKRKAAK
ncbi:unnamed protein product [Effrenium voratum]|nr:unnamed protein product [Effrenium voratum]CAJ1433106.1 unnamed protein product [Effrenium voratum]